MRKKTTLTPWFVNGECPVHPGVYNVSCRKKFQTGDWFAKWDGKTWYVANQGRHSAEQTLAKTGKPNHWHEQGSWRGRTSPAS